MVESSGLLNRRRVKSSTGGSNPPLSAISIIYRKFQGIETERSGGQKRRFANPLLIRQTFTPASAAVLSVPSRAEITCGSTPERRGRPDAAIVPTADQIVILLVARESPLNLRFFSVVSSQHLDCNCWQIERPDADPWVP